ncbi:MAG TPA: universal stress protein [Candidatus Luteimonas excrementigallinarum]|nr:universal stress protein [Candidatus Luteimonas excrementigallinarum]
MKILVAVDGSDISMRAVRFVIALNRKLTKPARVTMMAVDPPPFPGVETRIGTKATRQMHEETLESMLKDARRSLSRAKLELNERAEIGEIADTILNVAKKERVDLIVLGSHGRGAVKGILLGSVSSKVIAQTEIPVTIVR